MFLCTLCVKCCRRLARLNLDFQILIFLGQPSDFVRSISPFSLRLFVRRYEIVPKPTTFGNQIENFKNQYGAGQLENCLKGILPFGGWGQSCRFQHRLCNRTFPSTFTGTQGMSKARQNLHSCLKTGA